MRRAAQIALISLGLATTASAAGAQDTEPPPAAAAPEPPPTPPPPPAADEQVFVDPELEGLAPTPTAQPAQPEASQSSSDASARLVLHSRFAGDLRHEDPREEIWESTTLGALDASVRRSQALRFALGMRARYHVAALAHDVKDASAQRYELDVLPTAGYADISPASGVHVQVGYQGAHLGRFDIFSASNVLAASDLRDGPATLPESASEIGQLAALLDYDINGWLSLRAVYVPFFTPHLIELTDSDYALFPATQEETDDAFDAAGEQLGMDAGISQVAATNRLRRLVRANLSRDDRNRIAASGFSAFAPEPSLANPQAALRLSAHGPAGELAVTAATALEHLPSLVLSQNFINAAYDDSIEAQMNLSADSRPITIEYKRFAVFSVDGAADVGPLSIGAEAAFMKGRSLYAARAAGDAEGLPGPGSVDLLQLGLRVEYVRGSEWLAVLETFAAYALNEPSDGVCKEPANLNAKSECRWMFLEDGHLIRGAAALVSFAPTGLGWHFELSAGVLTGPSVLFTPRIAYSIVDPLEVELGALFVEGKTPPPDGVPAVALGGKYDTVDQVFVGVRYQP